MFCHKRYNHGQIAQIVLKDYRDFTGHMSHEAADDILENYFNAKVDKSGFSPLCIYMCRFSLLDPWDCLGFRATMY